MDVFALQPNNIGPRPFGLARTAALIPRQRPTWLQARPPSEILRPGPWWPPKARLIAQMHNRQAVARAARSGCPMPQIAFVTSPHHFI